MSCFSTLGGVSTEGLRDLRPIRVDRNDGEIYLHRPRLTGSHLRKTSVCSRWFADTSKEEDARFVVADRLLKWAQSFRPNPHSDDTVALDYVIMDCPPRLYSGSH